MNLADAASPGDKSVTVADTPEDEESVTVPPAEDGSLSPAAPPAAPTPPSRRWMAALVAVALISGTAGALVTRAVAGPEASSTVAPAGSARSVQLSGERLDVAAVVAKAEPSVVSIRTGTGFGRGAGTGVILTTGGEILTNAH